MEEGGSFIVSYEQCDYTQPWVLHLQKKKKEDEFCTCLILPAKHQVEASASFGECVSTVYDRTVLKNGSCCTVRPGKVSCLQKFRHFWMIIRDLFFESRSTEATKIKKILQRYVIYISDQITVPYLNTETGNRRLNIVDGMFSLEERG